MARRKTRARRKSRKSGNRDHRQRSKPLNLESLDPRIMLDAAGVLPTDRAPVEQPLEFQVDLAAIAQVAASSSSNRTEVVFVDSGVEEHDRILSDLKASQPGILRHIVLLDDTNDGLVQVADELSRFSDVDAIHLVSHGHQAQLNLGNTTVGLDHLDSSYRQTLQSIGKSLSSGADILIYGCDLASGEAGREFVNRFSQLTGADVSASDDTTGPERLGGDWDLEVSVGDIESRLAFNPALREAFPTTLQIVGFSSIVASDGTASFDADDVPGNDSGPNNGIVRSHDIVTFNVDFSTDSTGATNPTISATLPAGMIWEVVPAVGTGANSGIFDSVTGLPGGDMRTIVVHMPDIGGALSTSIPIQARALGVQNGTMANGIQFSMDADELASPLTSTPVDLVISSAPFMDIRLDAPTFRGVFDNPSTGKEGAVYSYSLGILGQHPTRIGTDSFKGSAPIEDPFTFDVDLSMVTPGAEIFSWGASIGESRADDGLTRNYERGPNLSGGTETKWSRSNRPAGRTGEHTSNAWLAERSTPDSGDATIGVGMPGGSYPITVNGSDTDGPLPSNWGGGGVIPADQGWFASYQLHLWIPICDIDLGDDGIAGTDDDGVLAITPQITNFDPDDFWNDQNNYGDTDSEPTANNAYTHTVVSNAIGGPVKRLFEYDRWRWVETSTYWYAGDGVTSEGHQYDVGIHSGQNTGVLAQSGVIWGDKFDNTASKIVPISNDQGQGGTWSRIYSSQTTWSQTYGVDYVIEFGTGGAGGDPAGWTDWNSMGDATLADGETSTVWTEDPTDAALGGTPDPDTGVSDAITKWRVRLLRDLEPGETIHAFVTMETVGHSTLDLAADPTGDTIGDMLARTADFLQSNANPDDDWTTSEFNPLDNGWFPEGTSSDFYRGDRLRYVEAQVRVDKQVVDTGTGGNFIAGSSATFTIDPTVTIPGPDSGDPAEGVVVTDILPAGLTIVPGSLSPTSANGNPVEYCITCDGSDWTPSYPTSGLAVGFRYNYGDVPLNTALPQIQFDALVPFDAPNGQNYENTAIISSPSDPSEEEWRDSMAGITAVQVAALSVNKVAITPLVPEDTLMIYELGVANVSEDKDIPYIDTIDLLPWSGDEDGSLFSSNFTNINITDLDPSLDVYVTNQSPAVLDNQDSLPGDGFADAGVSGVHGWYDAPGDPVGDWEFLLSDVGGAAPFGMSDITAIRVVSNGGLNPQLPPASSTKWRLELMPNGNVGIPSDQYVNDISVRTDPVALAEPTFSGPATIVVVAPDVDIQKDVCVNEFGPCDAADDSHWVDSTSYTHDPDPTWRIRVENTGTSDLVDVTVTDPAMPTGMSMIPSTVSATSGDASGFDPTWNLSLVPGDVQYLTFDTSLDVVPDVTDFVNTVSVEASDQFGNMASDSDDAMVAYAPEIGVSKQQVSAVQNATNPAIYDVTYSVTVQNTALVVLDEIQIEEDVFAAFGPGFVGVATPPPTISGSSLSPGSSLPLTNPAWNGNLSGTGDALLLDGTSGILAGGDSFTIDYVIQVDPLLLPDPANETNQVTASSNGGDATDLSDDGNDPDGENPSAPGHNGTEDDPTPLRLPLINLEKQIVGSPTPAVSGVEGNFDVTYEFTIENTGTTNLTNIAVVEDFVASMGGAFVGVVDGTTVTATTATDNPDLNFPYDGGLGDADVFATAPEQTVFTFSGSTTNTTLTKTNYVGDDGYVIDPNQTYMLMADAFAGDGAGGNYDPASSHYLGFASYDVDGNLINMYHYSQSAGSTDTTLAAPLNPGDTTITLTDATGWFNGSTSHRRSIAWYGYTDSTGYTYPDYTYTRNIETNAWDAGGISGNTITLSSPWSGPALPAGEAVRNNQSGGTYQYVLLSNGHIDETGDTYTSNIGGATITNGVGGTTLFRPGTHSIRPLVLADFTNTGTQLNVSNFKLVAPNESLLEPEQSVTFQITVEIDPNAPGAIYDGLTSDGNGDLENQATVSATDPVNGGSISEASDDPTDPTDANPDSDGDPDDPTALILSDIGISKQVIGTPTQLANGNYSVDYQIVVENTGAGNIHNIQVTEDLETEFGADVFAGVIFSPAITTISAAAGSTDPVLDGAWDGGLGGSSNTTIFNGTSGTLVPGDQFTIRFTVEVDPDATGTATPLDNQAVASAEDGTGSPVSDDSDSGADPNSDNPSAPGDMGTTDDPTPLSIPEIALAKQVNGPYVDNGDGTWTIPYQFVLENTGTTDLANPSIVDNIMLQIGAVVFDSVANIALDTSGVTGGTAPGLGTLWNGMNGVNLLDGSGTLVPGDHVTVTFDLIVDGTALAAASPLTNQGTGSAAGPDGNVDDLSDDGDDPNTENAGTPGDMGTTDDPTPILIPQIGLAKQVFGAPVALANGNYNVAYQMVLQNTGTVDLDNLQITEDLETEFGAGVFVSVITTPSIVAGPSDAGSTPPTLDGSWDGGLAGSGNTDLFNGTTGLLVPGDSVTVRFVVQVDPDATGTSTPLENTATATADDPNGIPVMDDSDDGTHPNNGEDDPTPLTLPEISLAKQVNGAYVDNGDATWTIPYQLVLENTGTVDLDNPSLVDNISAQLGTSFISVSNVSLDATGVAGGTAPALGGTWDGTNADNILDGTGILVPGDQVVITFDLLVDGTELSNNSPLENQATAQGDGPSGSVMDLSDDGDDPNSDNPTAPGDDGMGGTDNPTPIQIPQIGLSKDIVGTPTALANGNYSVTYQFILQNTGTVDLINLQIVEDLEAEFGAGVFVGVTSSPTITSGANQSGSTVPILDTSWDGGLGGSPNSDIFNGTSGTLVPDDSVTVRFVVEVDPDAMGMSTPLENTAVASGEGPNGTVVMDDSDDGTDPNNGEDDPTPLSLADVSVAKQVNGAYVDNGDGTWTIPYQLVLENTGSVDLNNPSIVDDIATQLGTAYHSVASVALDTSGVVGGTAPGLSGTWTGSGTSNILDGSGTLAPGDQVVVTFDLLANGTELAANSPLTNQATGSGGSSSGPISDLSDDGDDPNSDNPTAPGDSGMGSMDDPTPILIPQIGLAKQIIGAPSELANGNYEVVYELVMQNTGTVDLTDLQLTEDLETEFGTGVFVAVTSAPTITAGPNLTGSIPPLVDSNWDGGLASSSDIDIFNGTSGTLLPNDTISVRFTVEVDPDATGSATTLNNTAQASGEGPLGTTVIDDSDDGNDPNNGEDDPTPLEIADVSLAKQVNGPYVDNGDGTWTIPYQFVLANTGTTTLTNPSIIDNVMDQIGSAVFVNVSNIALDTTGVVGGTAPGLGAIWNGMNAVNLLDDTGSLASGDQVVVTFDLLVNGAALAANSPLTNQGTGAGTDSSGTVTDLSDDGSDPTSDNAGSPGDDGMGGTDDPTPIEIPQIGLAKQVIGNPTQLASGNYSVTYELVLKNTGTVDLNNLQLTEDLESEFGVGAFVGIITAPTITSGPNLVGSTAPNTSFTWDGGLGGSASTGIFDGFSGMLVPNDMITVRFTIEVDPDASGASSMLDNTARASGQAPNGVTVDDDSDDGTNPTNGEDDPTPLVIPEVAIVKQVNGPFVDNGDETYTVPYQLILENNGTTDLTNPTITDNIHSLMGAAFISVGNLALDTTGVTGGTAPGLGGTWNGANSDNLLDGTGTLAPGDFMTVTFDLTIDGRELANNSPLNNQAIGSGDGPMGTVSDDSDDGDDPNGTNPGTPGDMGTSDDPTPIEIPQVGLAKQIKGAPTILANENVLVTYRLVLANTGTVDLDNIQINEDIETQYGSGVLIAVSSAPAITVPPSLTGSISPILATWDGGLGGSANTNIFNGTSGTLLPGDFIEVEFTLEIDPDAMGATQPLLNQAVASGEGPDGTVVMDDSDDGTDPNSDNPGSPGDMGTSDDPTPFAVANIAAAKETVGTPMQVAPGSTNFEVTYQVVIQNTGNLNMTGIDLYDDLPDQFGSAFVSIPSSPTIVADTLTGAAVLPTINPGWMTNPSQSLLNDDGQMSPGDTITLQYAVVVNSSQASGTLLNQAEVIADNPFTGTEDGPSDLSDDGSDPTGTNAGSPGDMGAFDDPTPVVLPNGTVGVAKNSIWNDANDTVEFRFNIEHFGNVGVSGLSMTENLDAVLGAGNYSITSGPSLTFGPNTVVVNPGFDGSGDTDLLDPSSAMNPGQTSEIVVSVAVDTIADPQGNGLGIYVNQVGISSEDADGNTYLDVSTNGSDPDPDGDGDPTNNTVPSNGVLTVDATVGGAKTATLAADNNSVTFDFYLEHFGNTPATTVSLVEDLNAVFGAFPYNVTSVNVVSAPATLSANGMFNGSSDTELIASGSMMAPGETAHIQVVVDIVGAGGSFENQGEITSTDIGGGTYMDETQDGDNPDPDGDGDPTNNDDPTQFAIANGEISGTVYVDLDGDGIQDPDEAGIPGVEITLTGTDIYGNPVSQTVLTDADGSYSFTGLSPGDYTLTQTQPDSFLDGADTQGNLGGSAGNDVINVTLSGSDFVAENYNFGEAGLDPSAVGKDLLISPDPADGGGGGPVPPGSLVESDTDDSPVRVDGSTVYVQGTSEDEVISVHAGTDSHRITISQVTYRYDASEIDTIRIDAGEGDDFVEVRGSELDDRVVLHKNHGSLRSDAYDIEFRNAPRIYAYGEGGLDHGYLVDSVGDDVFVTASSYSSMRDINNEYKNETKGFEMVTGNAIMGGFDIGTIFDSPEDDLFRIMPDFARMFGGNGVDLQANKFERLDAYARSAGNDRAEMVDSLGNDSFITRKSESRMTGDGFRTRAFDFETVVADSRRGGTDSVAFYDTDGNDTFVAGLNLTTMGGDGYEIQTRSFDTYRAVSRFGDDTAEFNEVRTSDELIGRNDQLTLTGQNRDQTATGFDTVKARSRNNQTASADIQNVDFLFETFGQWV